jgi:hypothetical protein
VLDRIEVDVIDTALEIALVADGSPDFAALNPGYDYCIFPSTITSPLLSAEA